MLLGSFFCFFGKTIHRNALSELHNKQFGLKPRHFSVGFTFYL